MMAKRAFEVEHGTFGVNAVESGIVAAEDCGNV